MKQNLHKNQNKLQIAEIKVWQFEMEAAEIGSLFQAKNLLAISDAWIWWKSSSELEKIRKL